MERNIRRISRRQFFKEFTLFTSSAVLASCKGINVAPTATNEIRPDSTLIPPSPGTAFPTSTASLTAEINHTVIPSQTPKRADTLVPANTLTPTPDVPRFMEPYLGNVYLGSPFQIILPEDVARLASLWGGEKTFSIKDPHVIRSAELTDEEIKQMSPRNIFWDPGVGLIFQTDNRRPGLTHIMLYAHSGYSYWTDEELPLDFFRKIINTNQDKLIGLNFALSQGTSSTNLEIVALNLVPQDNFNSAIRNYAGDSNPDKQKTPLFLWLNKVCDKNNSCIDINSYPFNGQDNLITFVTCYDTDLNHISNNRILVTAKVIQ